uniref:Protein LEO1 homolog n=1 Tax=Steinernema glaseri TaxID=37863 RepID=A0A1I8AQN8_9BILA
MLCFDELNCASRDVFSYMCFLAMEKCSKKSEKKRAACGGAAMRKRLLIKNFVAHMLSQETEIRKRIEIQQQKQAEERELEHLEDVYDVEKDDEDESEEFDEQPQQRHCEEPAEEEDEEDEEDEAVDEEVADGEAEVPILGYDAEDERVKLTQYDEFDGTASSDLYPSPEASLMDAVPADELMKSDYDLFDISAVGDENVIQIEWPDFQTVPTNQHYLIPCDSRELIFSGQHYDSYLHTSCSAEYEFALPDNILEDEPPMAASSDKSSPSQPLFTNLVNITPSPAIEGVVSCKEGVQECALYSFDENPRKRGRGLLEQDENSMYSLIVPKRVKLL